MTKKTEGKHVHIWAYKCYIKRSKKEANLWWKKIGGNIEKGFENIENLDVFLFRE